MVEAGNYRSFRDKATLCVFALVRVEILGDRGPDMLERVGARSHTMSTALGRVDGLLATERAGIGVKLIDLPRRLSLELSGERNRRGKDVSLPSVPR